MQFAQSTQFALRVPRLFRLASHLLCRRSGWLAFFPRFLCIRKNNFLTLFEYALPAALSEMFLPFVFVLLCSHRRRRNNGPEHECSHSKSFHVRRTKIFRYLFRILNRSLFRLLRHRFRQIFCSCPSFFFHRHAASERKRRGGNWMESKISCASTYFTSITTNKMKMLEVQKIINDIQVLNSCLLFTHKLRCQMKKRSDTFPPSIDTAHVAQKISVEFRKTFRAPNNSLAHAPLGTLGSPIRWEECGWSSGLGGIGRSRSWREKWIKCQVYRLWRLAQMIRRKFERNFHFT